MKSSTPAGTHRQDNDTGTLALGDRVAAWHRKHHPALGRAASASGDSRSMRRPMEPDKVGPALAVTYRIAQAFGISIGERVDQPAPTPDIEIVHGDHPETLFLSGRQCRIRTLFPLRRERHIEFHELLLAPGAARRSAAHYEDTRELLTLNQGAACIESGDTRRKREAGDSAHYRADRPHCISHRGDGELLADRVVSTP